MIAVVDFGMGNLRSVTNALQAVGGDSFVCSEPEGLIDAEAIILPGVGAFGAAMANLNEGGWVEMLAREVGERGKPFLGICLGLQVLARQGLEFGAHSGLGWIDGTVTPLPRGQDVRIPHIGWNDVRFERPGEGLSAGLETAETFYFVHGYAIESASQAFAKGTTTHGTTFVSCVEQDNVWATQFHPEKSREPGLRILRNFVERSR